MGANAIRRPPTQPDPVRNLSQIKAPRSTQPDSDRLPRTAKTSLTRKRSLVQIQYGPPGVSRFWPYQVALCGPTIGPTVRANVSQQLAALEKEPPRARRVRLTAQADLLVAHTEVLLEEM